MKGEVVDDRLLLPFVVRLGATESGTRASQPAATQVACIALSHRCIRVSLSYFHSDNMRNVGRGEIEGGEKNGVFAIPSGFPLKLFTFLSKCK